MRTITVVDHGICALCREDALIDHRDHLCLRCHEIVRDHGVPPWLEPEPPEGREKKVQ